MYFLLRKFFICIKSKNISMLKPIHIVICFSKDVLICLSLFVSTIYSLAYNPIIGIQS